jgi:hypothetical protein
VAEEPPNARSRSGSETPADHLDEKILLRVESAAELWRTADDPEEAERAVRELADRRRWSGRLPPFWLRFEDAPFVFPRAWKEYMDGEPRDEALEDAISRAENRRQRAVALGKPQRLLRDLELADAVDLLQRRGDTLDAHLVDFIRRSAEAEAQRKSVSMSARRENFEYERRRRKREIGLWMACAALAAVAGWAIFTR